MKNNFLLEYWYKFLSKKWKK